MQMILLACVLGFPPDRVLTVDEAFAVPLGEDVLCDFRILQGRRIQSFVLYYDKPELVGSARRCIRITSKVPGWDAIKVWPKWEGKVIRIWGYRDEYRGDPQIQVERWEDLSSPNP